MEGSAKPPSSLRARSSPRASTSPEPQHKQDSASKRRLASLRPSLANRTNGTVAATSAPATSAGARTKSPTAACSSQGGRSLSKLSPKQSAAAAPSKNDVLDSGSDSDSDDHYGFVKVDRWNPPPEPTMPAFKPTISQSTMNPSPSSPSSSLPSFASAARNSNIMARVRSTIRAAVTPATPVIAALSHTPTEGATANQPADASSSSSSGSDDNDEDSNGIATKSAASLSDEEISDVLDETELQLIEAMEDTQIVDAKGSSGNRALPKNTSLMSSPPRKGLSWMGLGDISPNNRVTYADSLKERFAVSQKRTGTTVKVSTGECDSDSSSSNSSDSGGSDREQRTASTIPIAAPVAAHTHQPLPRAIVPNPLPPIQSPSLGPPTMARAQIATTTSEAAGSSSTNARSDLFESRNVDSGADLARPASVPLDSVEFVAPGVTKKTAMSLLCRVLDIDGPIIQQKMVEFLLIDGVIASLIGFITHCQGSMYSPSPTSQTAPCSPSLCHEAGASCSPDSGCCNLPTSAAAAVAATADAASHESVPSQHVQPGHDSAASPGVANDKKDLPLGVLHEFEVRSQHRARLQRQRNRSAGLTDVDLRRGYNAVQMLATREQFSRRVMEAKLAVIVPCLMAVFHKDSLGSFHHACLLLEHCFTISPLRTTRLLLYQQNPPSRWWSLSESVAKGHAPICDILPYLSEPCVQRLFLKAEFGVWTGRLMTSLNLMPNDALVVSDELSRMGLASVAGALSGGAASDDSPTGQTQSQQRAKSLQLVRNRFQQLNRGRFFGHILELIEDPDPYVSEGVAEFMAFMINDCSTFYGFNILFKPICDSELPVRRLAQLIANSPAQRLSAQAKAATRLLHSLLTKTACQYGLRTREAQGIRDPEMHPRGSQVLLQVGQAARSALESFLPGLFATVTGLQGSTDLTSNSAFNRRASVESLRLPEYEEADPDFDTDGTEAAASDANAEADADGEIEGDDDDSCSSGSGSSNEADDLEGISPSGDMEFAQRFYGDNISAGYLTDDHEHDSYNDNDAHVADLRNSAAALFNHATYPESIGSGSISSSLSPSSTLSASPMAVASSTPNQPTDMYLGERLDAEDLSLLVSLPKPDINRLNLLRLCVDVLRETSDIDEIVGWIDLRVWRALSTWFLNHPHNNMLHMAVYQLISIVTLETVRLRRSHRRLVSDPRKQQASAGPNKSALGGASAAGEGYVSTAKSRGSGDNSSGNGGGNPLAAGGTSFGSGPEVCQLESRAQAAAKRRARRRRAMAERIRRDESTNCDNILTYLIEQNQWVDKLVRRAVSPSFDGAHGFISLILNTLRLAVQVDRRRPVASSLMQKRAERHQSSENTHAEPSPSKHIFAHTGLDPWSAGDIDVSKGRGGFSDDEVPDDDVLMPDMAYHDPETRHRLSEYPTYRLQRWEITLLYSPAFRAHLRRLRKQAERMARKPDEFRLCDQSRADISQSGTGIRPVPFFSPQKVKPPVSLDNQEIKKKQLQINVGLLLGNNRRLAVPATSSSSSSSATASSSSSAAATATAIAAASAVSGKSASPPIDEVGVDLDSLFARMLGFTEDLVELPLRVASDETASCKTGKFSGLASKGGIDGSALSDENSDEEKKPRREKRSASGSSGPTTRKQGVGTGSGGKAGSLRKKKSKPVASVTSTGALEALVSSSVSGILEDITPETAEEAAEALCSALASDGVGGSNGSGAAAKCAPGLRSRKKTVPASGSVRRRRARLHHKSSSSSLGGSPAPISTAASPSTAFNPAPAYLAADGHLDKTATSAVVVGTDLPQATAGGLAVSLKALDI
ncbi:hypothetical protein GGH94_003039 [Coemansia aciculifera]|uniref:Uncharacterized protein n=1 Tax=Coemansia aciculifera TaxID=417176 RepID=A0A9W8M654_9FUNG|nr:hypothetical protein GGH94_003039 [Coemansia aciculifera]